MFLEQALMTNSSEKNNNLAKIHVKIKPFDDTNTISWDINICMEVKLNIKHQKLNFRN